MYPNTHHSKNRVPPKIFLPRADKSLRAEFHLATLHFYPSFPPPQLSFSIYLHLSVSGFIFPTRLAFLCLSISNHCFNISLRPAPLLMDLPPPRLIMPSYFSQTLHAFVFLELRGWNTNSQPTSDSKPKATGRCHPPTVHTKTVGTFHLCVCLCIAGHHACLSVCLQPCLCLFTGVCLCLCTGVRVSG